MPIGAFLDKTHLPSPEEIQASLGSLWQTWLKFNQFITDSYKTAGEFKFYGKNYGWAVRFRKGGKALLSIYPGQEGFTVQIILSEQEIAQACQGGLGVGALKAIAAANPYPEGRWLYLEVDDMEVVDDIQKLVTLKSPPPRHARRAP